MSTIDDAKAVITCIWGRVPETGYHADEMFAAGQILDRPGMTPDRVSKVMAWVSCDAHWSTVVASAEKLNLHFEKIVAKMKKDPSAEGYPGWQALAPREDTCPEDQREARDRSLQGSAVKEADLRREMQQIIDRATQAGLEGPAIGRYFAVERGKQLKAMGKGDGSPCFDPHWMEKAAENPRRIRVLAAAAGIAKSAHAPKLALLPPAPEPNEEEEHEQHNLQEPEMV